MSLIQRCETRPLLDVAHSKRSKPLPDGHPLFSLDNAIVSPHISWSSTLNFVRAVEVLRLNKERLGKGEEALTAVEWVA
jgi:phosphoglycerate dehydrogenase-like enzyme